MKEKNWQEIILNLNKDDEDKNPRQDIQDEERGTSI